jgi:oxaloacetate decarboxylase gamma subunit
MAESLETGLVLMVAGMGTVFALLALLVWLVQGVSKLSHWLAPPVAAAAPASTAPSQSVAADGELVSVIAAAVKAHRDRRARL